jgi:hypothetical protein
MQDQGSSRSRGKIALLVGGIVLALLALTVAAAGGTGIWATTTQKDDHGYLSTDRHAFRSPARAITTGSIDLDTGIPQWLLGKIRIEAESGPSSRTSDSIPSVSTTRGTVAHATRSLPHPSASGSRRRRAAACAASRGRRGQARGRS